MTLRRSSLADLPARAVLGHRGNRAHAPENTLRAFVDALALGAHGLEFDVRLTKDGIPVVFHDETLERTTNGVGALRNFTWDQLREFDAGYQFTRDSGATFPFRDRGIGISRLVDVLQSLPPVPTIVEIKEVDAAPVAERVILDCAAEGHCTVGAFRHATMMAFAKSRVPRTASTREIVRAYVPALLGRQRRSLPFQAMSLPPSHHGLPLPLRSLARFARQADVPLYVWTINEPPMARVLWNQGVHGVLSDDPGPLLAAREPTVTRLP